MANNFAAFWSAIAATFAAASSFLIYRTQVKNLRYSARPDIVLSNWTRTITQNGDNDKISFSEVENIGNGTAEHIYIS